MLDKIKDLSDSIIRLDLVLGFKKIAKYVLLGLIIFTVVNIRAVVRDFIGLFDDIKKEMHDEKMKKRDDLMIELLPILREYRVVLGADRILYFEYHNSKENLVGIPFKYIDLVLQDTRYGVQPAPREKFQSINSGAITPLYEDIKHGRPVLCNGSDDLEFRQDYSGVYDIFNITGNVYSERQAYISIPGIKQPLGLIVLEWDTKPGTEQKKVESAEEIKEKSELFISRINALIVSKR